MKILKRNWLIVFLLASGLAGGSIWIFAQNQPATVPAEQAIRPRILSVPDALAEQERATIGLFEAASPSVVYITSISVKRDFFSLNLLEIPSGTGSGFIWDKQGHIVTNFHVIQDANVAQVTLADQSTWNAKLVGVEPDKDLAVLRIDAPEEVLKPIEVGTSSGLRVGQFVLAIGNPFGFDQTLTTGVISGIGREIKSATRRTIRGVIQTDAAINPGNSGGPLMDSSGRLIGINTAIFSPSGAYAGVGFAVPVDTVRRMVPQLIEHGRVIKPVLGITSADSTQLRGLNLKGVLVLNVLEGGGAAKAGLRPTRRDQYGRLILGDIIVAVDGQKVTNLDEMYQVLEEHEIGDVVSVVVRRTDEITTLQVELSASE